MDFIVDYSIGKGFIINIAAEAAAMNKRDYIMGLQIVGVDKENNNMQKVIDIKEFNNTIDIHDMAHITDVKVMMYHME